MKITVLITGASGGGVGRQCIKSLRLGKLKYRIIATDTTSRSLGLYTDIDKAYLVPTVTDPNYLDTIFKICAKEKVQILIPGSEAELKIIGTQLKQFKKKNILVLTNNAEVINNCLDKWSNYKKLKSLGFNVPESYLPKNSKDIDLIKKFPVVIKPYTGGGGSRGVFIAQNKKELSFFLDYLFRQGVSPVIQEYIGSPDEEYTVGVLHSLKGKLLGSFALKRVVKGAMSVKSAIKDYKNDNVYVISTGISQGEVDDFPEVRKYAEKIANKIKSTGPLNIQCRKEGDKIYVFEINPRFSGTSAIRALCGYNEVETLIKIHLLGQKPVKMTYKSGLVLRDLENFYIDKKRMRAIEEQGI